MKEVWNNKSDSDVHDLTIDSETNKTIAKIFIFIIFGTIQCALHIKL